MVRSLVEEIVWTLNPVPTKNSISDTIVEGRPKPDFSQKKISFGAYKFVDTGTSNNMKTRDNPTISLSMTNNAGGYYFMSLHTGKHI